MQEYTTYDLEEILQIKMGYPFDIEDNDIAMGTIKAQAIMLDTGRFIYSYGERWWEMTEEQAKEMIDRAKGEDINWVHGFHRVFKND
jgi:hypothetical protein